MPSWSLTISLGSNSEGQKRKEIYQKTADKNGITLSEWAKTTLDEAAGIKRLKVKYSD
jgi:hypothetical protein